MRSLQIEPNAKLRRHKMSFGAEVKEDGKVLFQLAASSAKTVDLLLYGSTVDLSQCSNISDSSNDEPKIKLSLEQVQAGRFELLTDSASVGTSYKFLIDNGPSVPDPASRYQIESVHGRSLVVDPGSYQWQEFNWQGKAWEEAVIYELHVGIFTAEGTFAALENKLDYLLQLGVTAIELMPIAEFPGQRNWGYDGVLLYAPTNKYGKPNELKHFIDICHQKGLMVFLDVVYNHFGPEGNYLHTYAKNFFNDRHKTPWGAALNYDGADSDVLREFIINNALYWLDEFFFDGLRLDAVHAIHDDRPKHIINDICEAISKGPGAQRQIHIILENDNNQVKFLDPKKRPFTAQAQWNDDIHHVFHVIASGEKEGYYSDYTDSTHAGESKDSAVSKLGRALAEGFVYQGQQSLYRKGETRGELSRELPTTSFISFLQNHDQIGNRAFGERLCAIADKEILKVLTAVFLLAPQIPMLFMGEEWAASSPFFYFCNLGPDLAPLVTEGRRNEFKNFSMFADKKIRATIPDPCTIETYEKSILQWQEIDKKEHKEWLSFYTDLLVLRKQKIMPLLKLIKAGHYLVSGESILNISWRMENGRDLKLMANLSGKSIDNNIDFVSVQPKDIIFQYPIKLVENLSQSLIPADSVIWYLA